jgi:branched-subunit amino acid transport protein
VAFAALAGSAVAASAAGGAGELVPRLVAITVAVAVAHRTRSTGWTVISGMAVLWLWP